MTTLLTRLLAFRNRRFNSRNQPGAMVVRLHATGISLVTVSLTTSSVPRVEIAKFYPCDETAQAATLEKIAKEYPAAGRHCYSLLNPTQYQILTVEAPKVPQAEKKTAVRWLLKDLIDYPSSEATLDVLSIPSKPGATEGPASVMAIVARSSAIRKYQSLLSKQLPLTVIDIPELAQRNIASFAEDPDRGLALVSFDKDGGLLTITCHGDLYTARRIDVSADQFLQTDVTRRQASLERAVLEIQRSLDNFERQFNHVTVSKLLLAPMPGAGLILNELKTSLFLPVDVLDLHSLVNIAMVPGLEDPINQQQYFLSIGAALRDMECAP